MSHSNISIFVPHLGCPHQCSFCNQKYITGCSQLPHAKDIDSAVNIALNSVNFSRDNSEIAFFGGSFTAIEREYMLELLTAASKYVKNGSVAGIRISTRPDCIDKEILQLLKLYCVTSIELGAQSMVDEILIANNRGHLSNDVVTASKLIKQYGFSLGLQMMTGLYKSSEADDLITAKRLIELQPDTVRIYPTITIKSTHLEKLYKEGKYTPQTLSEAVALVTKLEDMFIDNKINVIRIGLHSIENDSYVCGPWHPAFRELCETNRYKNRLDNLLKENNCYIIYVNGSNVSKIIGHNRSNIKYFSNKNIKITIKQDNSISKSDFIIEEVKKDAAYICSDSRF